MALEKIDINSLDDSNLGLEIDVDANPFSMPPPPDDGKYRATIKLKERDGSLFHLGKDKNGNSYIKTEIEARIVQPGGKFDDWPIFDNFVSTMNMPNSDTSKVAGIVKFLGGTLSKRTTHKELALLLQQKVGDGAEIGIVTQWRASVKTGKKLDNGKDEYEEVRGQKRFKQRPDKSYDPVIVINGEEAQAQAQIVRYVSLADLNGTH